MIPKKIHFVWLGPNKKSELSENCIQSWRQHCPDWDIREWGNADVAKIRSRYLEQAIYCGRWAFASDYMRLYALASEGGFYLDTDLELTSSLEDLTQLNFVIGFERYANTLGIGTALIGASPSDNLICRLLSHYDGLDFLRSGLMDLTPNTRRFEAFFAEHFKITLIDDSTFFLGDGSIIFPSGYFCARNEGVKNYAIHHFLGSWGHNFVRTRCWQMGRLRFAKFRVNQFQKNHLLKRFPMKLSFFNSSINHARF